MGKIARYWLCGFVISAILLVAFSMIFTVSALFLGGDFLTTTTDPTTGKVIVTGINPIAIAVSAIIGFVVVPVLIGLVSDWVTDKLGP